MVYINVSNEPQNIYNNIQYVRIYILGANLTLLITHALYISTPVPVIDLYTYVLEVHL